ncbi:SDR family oxidoreductase [Brachybacterium alimentarium]|uniref:SDR family oxidoreductase n=1 Tax=Brachybacterium alimentarium TaxID=47845 RepID=UPI000BB85080|nr:SDR family oxidoreductase [Brachybacterium alimentarium]PCC33654.1 short-chain dehydrogenase [Brachybacterium alimentarium]RCS69550.1 SDR family NAD(P)-dependent oxidoreductase [Brachybacterium alimentarium]RCS88253.1 SDR family NAD(P)-dependent oxidoreductase [Brachybacterium alimentarium]
MHSPTSRTTPPLPRTALITGVGRRRGIGAAIARGLAADGYDLALNYHDPYDRRVLGEKADVDLLAEELRADGRRVELLPGDLEDPAVPPSLVAAAREELGPLGVLVTCHCESVDSSILDTTVESFDRHYAVNLRATWLLLKAFAEQVEPGRDTAGGAMIALTSDHTVHNLPYGATKGALDRLVLAGTHELADRDVRTNVINPGPIDTGWMDDEIRASGAASTPAGRLGGTDTVADLVRFLVSQQGAWIRGQLLYSNGGFASPAL